MEDYICKCIKCDLFLIDHNPADQPLLPSDDVKKELKIMEDDDGYFWGCPECKSDAHLIDVWTK